MKKEAKLEDNLFKLNIDVKSNAHKIIDGINFLRLKNNPVKIVEKDILELILNNNSKKI